MERQIWFSMGTAHAVLAFFIVGNIYYLLALK